MYEYAIKLIKKGKAYVCDLSPEEIREYRGTLTEPGKNSPYRDRSVEENLKLFEEMKNGTYEGIDSYIPQIDNPKNEIFGYQKPKIKQKFAELWTKVKAK